MIAEGRAAGNLHAISEGVGQPEQSRFGRWVERAVLLALVLYIGIHTLPRAWKSLVTDFPSYYIAAELAHQGYDTSRMYEWQWLEREKDRQAIPIRVIGLVPITPFSTLFISPLTPLKPLSAKRVWILLNLALLIPIAWMLRSMTGINYRRIALLFALSVPFYRNLEFGQFYVLLLLMIVAACWAFMRGNHGLAGALIAIAAACKIFPLLFFVSFLQRRSWRGVLAGAVAAVSACGLSIAVFGWSVHRTYLEQILPAALHGEAFPPYVTNASISGILHILFLAEPQWNPNPWHPSVMAFSFLLPALQMIVLAPAILLIRRDDNTPGRMLLEWSALLTASLAISTIPASYNFVLMVLPMCVLSAILLKRREYGRLAALIVAYLGIGFPMPSPAAVPGLKILLTTPRLPLMVGILIGICALLWPSGPLKAIGRDWTRWAWASALIVVAAFNAHSTLARERIARAEFAYRLPLKTQGLLNANPQPFGDGVRYIAFTLDGYRLITEKGTATSMDPAPNSTVDDLSFTSGLGHLWVERASSPQSELVDLQNLSLPVVAGAHDPMLSADGQSLAFLRDDHGRGKLMLRTESAARAAPEIALTPASLNVYEASFRSDREFAFSAASPGGEPQIYLTDATHINELLDLGEARYPALSPDGNWLAYSHLRNGVWNLWVRNQATGETRRIGNVPCNEIEPAWESDSKTLLYSTDCGRSLWFTAVGRRTINP